MDKNKKLYRIEEGSKLFGVCGGLAEYLDTDPTIVRVLWVFGSLLFGCGILAYLLCALLIPKKSEINR